MKKFHEGQILLWRNGVDVICVVFYQVLRSTSRTCEVRELQKKIVEQSLSTQKVIPIEDDFAADPPIRCPVLDTGCVKIAERKYAWPWDGTPELQTPTIYIP